MMYTEQIIPLTNNKKPLMSMLLMTAMFLAMNETAFSENIFSWNADCVQATTCSTSLGPILTLGPHTSLDTTTKHSGIGSMRLDIPGDSQSQVGIEPGKQIILNKTQPIFYRWWMKFDAGFKWGPGVGGSGFAPMKMNRVKQDGDILPGYFTFKMERDYIAVGECNNCLPQGSGGDPSPAIWHIDLNPVTNPNITNWHEYIIEVKFETSHAARDGYFKAYLDGILQTTVTGQSYALDGLNAPAEAWGGMMVRPLPQLNGGASDGGTIWVDDISSDTTWNSLAGGARDTVAPVAPTGLQILKNPTTP